MKYINYIFDFDGTVVDSKGDVSFYLKKTFQEFGILYNKEHLSIGPPLPEIIKLMAPDIDSELCMKIVKRFREYYNNCDFEYTYLYPNVKNAIETLYNNRNSLFVATNKPQIPTKLILDKFGLTPYFKCLATPDIFSERILNKTEMVQHLIDEFQLDKSKTLMIGDAVIDIRAGKSCGIDTAVYLKGYTDEDTLKKENPDLAFDDYSFFT